MQVVGGVLYYDIPGWRSPGRLMRVWMVTWKLVRWLGAGRIYRDYVDRTLPEHLAALKDIEERDISGVRSKELSRGFVAAIDAYLGFQETSYPMIAVAMTSVGILDRLCRLLFGKGARLRAHDFLAGLENATVKRDLALYSLGGLLAEVLSRDEISNLDCGAVLGVQANAGGGKRFSRELERFLASYGYIWADRYPRDPAWELNEESMVASLKRAAERSVTGGGLPEQHSGQRRHRAHVLQKATDQVRWSGPLFRWFLNRAEQFFPHKENRNHYVYHAVMVIKEYALEIGRRLEEQRLLESRREVFFLKSNEILDALSGSMNAATIRRCVRERSQAFERGRQEQHRLNSGFEAEEVWRSNGQGQYLAELAGEPCSSGWVAGPARLVLGFGDLGQVRPGDIVVCGHMRPAWSTVLARAGGVVVETGNLLSHGATLAREYGVPAVMNVPGITRVVREGDRLTVDGNAGRVAIERLPPEVTLD
jgi:pyruvate,water dikinase